MKGYDGRYHYGWNLQLNSLVSVVKGGFLIEKINSGFLGLNFSNQSGKKKGIDGTNDKFNAYKGRLVTYTKKKH